ncbi:MAG: Ldh family oxidoreductase [Clostridia bacterium]|nr:Ldh family oxidoreductase [Clostridia bacterium]
MKIKINELRERCEKLFCAASVTPEDAAIITDVILTTEMRGVFTHGFFRVPRYLSCMEKGGISPASELKLLADLPSFATADGEGGLGIVLSYKAMALAIEKARATGVGVVSVRNSHHFGAAGYYAEMAAKAGMIGLSMSNGDPLVAVTGSCVRSIGNNPFSYAAPAGKYGNIVYDIAMSHTSDIKVLRLAEEGKPCPEGWIIDKAGRPTTNPSDYINGGVLLPFGGYKGYGLAMMVEVMGAALSGSAMLGGVRAWNDDPTRTGGVGHTFMALDVSKVDDLAAFTARTEMMLDTVKGAALAEGTEKIYFPGEIERDRMAACLAAGEVDIADTTAAAFCAAEARYGLA